MPCAHERRLTKLVAFHEAGHAVVAQALDFPVHYATIVPNLEEESLGHVRLARLTRPVQPGSGVELLGQMAMISAGGLVAQRILFPRSSREFATTDLASIDAKAAVVCAVGNQGVAPPEQRRPFERRAFAEARKIIVARWWQLKAIAERLLQDRHLSGHAIAQIAREATEEWKQLSQYSPGLSAIQVARAEARASKPRPPLRRRHVEAAVTRGVMAGARDMRQFINEDLVARGFTSTEINSMWERITNENP